MSREDVRAILAAFAWTCIVLACGIAVALLLTSCGPRRYETVTCKDGSISSGTGRLCAGHGGRA